MLGSNNSVTTKRRSEVNGKNIYPSTNHLDGVECYIERASAEITSMFGDIPAFNQYLMICEEVVDIKVGDLVTDQQGRSFKVFANPHYDDNVDTPNHTEVLMDIGYKNDS